MSAEKSARKIIESCRNGEAELTLSVYGKLATLVHGISPGFMADYFALINRILPEPGSNQRAKGLEINKEKTPDWAKSINASAAERNNEV